MPSSWQSSAICDSPAHGPEGRIGIWGVLTERLLDLEINDILGFLLRVPQSRRTECRARLRDEALLRMRGTSPGVWTREDLLSLIRGCGGYTMISKDLLGCATSRNKGTCDNRLNIRRDALEASVLSGLRTHMEPDLFKEFCDEFTREVNRLRIERGAGLAAMRDELPRIERELGELLAAIKAGGPIEAIVEDMKRLEARKAVLKDQLANAEEPRRLLHPNMAEIYRQRIAALYESLQNEDGKTEAAEVFRTLVDQVTLVPDKAELAIVLRGDLASILRFAANKKNPDVLSEAGVLVALLSQESLVAGTRNTRFRRNGTGVLEIGVSQEMMVVGARITRFLRLVETVIPRLAAWTIAFPKVEVTRSHRVWCATSLQNWALQKLSIGVQIWLGHAWQTRCASAFPP
ncbi:hypothetical protein ACVWZ3_000129 [Bradyrhizobium sp. i1.3.6]